MRYKRVQKLKYLFKKESIVGEQPDTTIKENQLDFPIDRTDYFFRPSTCILL